MHKDLIRIDYTPLTTLVDGLRGTIENNAAETKKSLERLDEAMKRQQADIQRQQAELQRQQADFQRQQADLQRQQTDLQHHQAEVQQCTTSLDKMQQLLQDFQDFPSRSPPPPADATNSARPGFSMAQLLPPQEHSAPLSPKMSSTGETRPSFPPPQVVQTLPSPAPPAVSIPPAEDRLTEPKADRAAGIPGGGAEASPEEAIFQRLVGYLDARLAFLPPGTVPAQPGPSPSLSTSPLLDDRLAHLEEEARAQAARTEALASQVRALLTASVAGATRGGGTATGLEVPSLLVTHINPPGEARNGTVHTQPPACRHLPSHNSCSPGHAAPPISIPPPSPSESLFVAAASVASAPVTAPAPAPAPAAPHTPHTPPPLSTRRPASAPEAPVAAASGGGGAGAEEAGEDVEIRLREVYKAHNAVAARVEELSAALGALKDQRADMLLQLVKSDLVEELQWRTAREVRRCLAASGGVALPPSPTGSAAAVPAPGPGGSSAPTTATTTTTGPSALSLEQQQSDLLRLWDNQRALGQDLAALSRAQQHDLGPQMDEIRARVEALAHRLEEHGKRQSRLAATLDAEAESATKGQVMGLRELVEQTTEAQTAATAALRKQLEEHTAETRAALGARMDRQSGLDLSRLLQGVVEQLRTMGLALDRKADKSDLWSLQAQAQGRPAAPKAPEVVVAEPLAPSGPTPAPSDPKAATLEDHGRRLVQVEEGLALARAALAETADRRALGRKADLCYVEALVHQLERVLGVQIERSALEAEVALYENLQLVRAQLGPSWVRWWMSGGDKRCGSNGGRDQWEAEMCPSDENLQLAGAQADPRELERLRAELERKLTATAERIFESAQPEYVAVTHKKAAISGLPLLLVPALPDLPAE
ncbi:hypothetical protein PAPYR_1703 [Paratrimastix pyriformis]|uniref:Uncharacterized protein n=1 Tax=Paratrimastix pyriformis TaxID=342808 RepID=A0ABQ8US83_9EUKA|nr:hypothetical protein PAPYR_1703 [Paratrimastix pyriformis]